MTSFAETSASVNWSTEVSVCEPVISLAFPVPTPIYPKITLYKDLFIALHIIYDKIAPEDPIKDPTIVNSGFESIKPSAHKAQPEYELSTVIATGISAAPIENITFQPNNELVNEVTSSAPTPIGIDCDCIIATRDNIDIKANGLFNSTLKGKSRFLPLNKLANLINAAIEPVNVTPPIKVPKNEAIQWKLSGWPCAIKEAIEVAIAARPTRAWNAATVYGNSVTATLLPITVPTANPAPIRVKAYIKTAYSKFIIDRVVNIPPEIPIIPKALPVLAVFWEANPAIPPIQQRELAKYPIEYTPG